MGTYSGVVVTVSGSRMMFLFVLSVVKVVFVTWILIFCVSSKLSALFIIGSFVVLCC